MTSLTVLALEGLLQLQELVGLEDCPALQTMSVSTCPNLRRLSLRALTRLQELHIVWCDRLQEVAGVSELCSLTRLVVAACAHLKELDWERAASPVNRSSLAFLETLQLGLAQGEAAPAAGGTSMTQSEVAPVRPPFLHAHDTSWQHSFKQPK
jgi:hypothetical protein